MRDGDPLPSPRPGWIPADQRWLGLDRRSLLPAAIVLAIVIVLAGVLPAVAQLLTIGWVLRAASERERVWMRDVLQPEVEAGVLTGPEAAAVAGGRRERRAVLWAADGHGARRAAKHVLAAANDLAQEIARSGGRDSPPVEHARAEVARLRTA